MREASGKKQADIAAAISVDQSTISRLADEMAGFLRAVRTLEAEEYQEYLNRQWLHLPRPEFRHPEISALAKAETCFLHLDQLLSEDSSGAVGTQVKMHREALQRAVSYLVDRKHKLAFIGQIGVGKSAAVSILFSLLVPTDDGKPALERTLLPLGTGRITLCEVEITQAANFAILIEPEPDEEVLRLVSDLCAD
ncbi:MAG: hypothetical protein DMG25_10760, partial [Acidobacteria bacterium]